jgi:type II secretory pathway pseudopilin PulG
MTKPRPTSILGHRASHLARAFTITELLVVITLIIILVLIAVPSFSAMIYSSEESLAESQLRAAMRAARDAAVRSNGGADGAVVFFFESGGRLTMLPCVKVGEISDWTDSNAAGAADNTKLTRRDVFAAAPGFSAIALPKYWMVRGFAPAHSMTTVWYGGNLASATTYNNTNEPERQWVFPETGFFNIDAVDDGYNRSTFMVRFRAGTGELIGGSTAPALVLSPRNSSQGRTGPIFGDTNSGATANYRADRAEDPIQFIQLVLARPITTTNTASDKRRLIGRLSSDMVLARPVMQVALYNENRLAGALGTRVDRTTDCLYAPPPLNGSGLPNYNMYVPAYAGIPSGSDTPLERISRFIEGDTNLDNVVNGDDKPEAKLFSIDRYSGALRRMEVQP